MTQTQVQPRSSWLLLVLAAICLLSLSFPLATPFIAVAAMAAIFPRRHTTVAKAAFVVCALALVLSLVIDVGLLATTVSAGVPQRS